MKSILLDAGHGGMQVGHISPTGLLEKNLTLATAEAVAQALDPMRFSPYFSRVSDHEVSHRERQRIAAACDATVSLHWHATGNPYAHWVDAHARIEAGEVLGRLLLDHVTKATGDVGRYRPTSSRITCQTMRPVVIITCGFISNPEVEADILHGYRIDAVASAIAAGLAQHFS